MGNKTAGLHLRLLLTHELHIAVMLGTNAHFFLKEHAERTHTLEPHLVTHIGHRPVVGQQLPGFIEPLARQVLVRCFAVHPAKKPVEVKTRKAGLTGNTIQADGLVKMLVHEQLGRYDPLICVGSQFHSSITVSNIDKSTGPAAPLSQKQYSRSTIPSYSIALKT